MRNYILAALAAGLFFSTSAQAAPALDVCETGNLAGVPTDCDGATSMDYGNVAVDSWFHRLDWDDLGNTRCLQVDYEMDEDDWSELVTVTACPSGATCTLGSWSYAGGLQSITLEVRDSSGITEAPADSGEMWLSFEIAGGTISTQEHSDAITVTEVRFWDSSTCAFSADTTQTADLDLDYNFFDNDLDGVDQCNDNCVNRVNTDQLDTDGDGYGNKCDSDYNQSNTTTTADYITFGACFGTNPPIVGGPAADPTCEESDCNGDGEVASPDRNCFNLEYGNAPGPGAGSGPSCS